MKNTGNELLLAHRRRIHQATIGPELVKRSFSLNAKGSFAATDVFLVVFAIVTYMLDDIIGPIFGES